jgi:hypothetical protein
MVRKTRIEPGHIIEPQEFLDVRSERVRIPDLRHLVHLQFRRFAGCPVCDLHLHAIAQRHGELLAASIREVVVFHSTAENLLPHARNLPFTVIADPDKCRFAEFGVESGARALLDPRVWVPIVRGVTRSLGRVVRREQSSPTLNPHGGRFGLPAEFLIAGDGKVLACKYGSHAYDQWPVDEILGLAREHVYLNAAPTQRKKTNLSRLGGRGNDEGRRP